MTATLLSWPVVPCPRPFAGLTGLGLCVGTDLAVGTVGCAVVAAGLSAGFGGMDLVPALVLTIGI